MDLWKTSGHFDFYKENMYDQMEVENEEYQLKPMNCPFHVAVYKHGLRSYRELPVRMAELGTVYRWGHMEAAHAWGQYVWGSVQVEPLTSTTCSPAASSEWWVAVV